MSTATDLSLKDSTAAAKGFTLTAKDNGYAKWSFLQAGGRLVDAITVALKLKQPAKLTDTTIITNRLIVTSPNFNAEGLSLAPNIIEVNVSMLASSTELQKANLLSFAVEALSATIIKGQITTHNNIV